MLEKYEGMKNRMDKLYSNTAATSQKSSGCEHVW